MARTLVKEFKKFKGHRMFDAFRRLSIILTAFLLMLCLASCDKSSDTKTESDRPYITIGGEDYPPFTDLDNNGDPTGLDIDILKEAFDRIGYDIKFVEIEWEDKDELLASGEVDCVAGGFTIEGREDEYLWIGPYMYSNQVVVVNNTEGIKSLQDLEGKTISLQSSSIAEDILLEHMNPNIPANVQIYSYEDNAHPFAALGSDYTDAIVADEPVAIQYMKDYDVVFTILDEPVMYASVGTAFAKDGDAKLCAKVNDAIEQMRKDGTLKKIISRYLDDADRYLVGGDDIEE